MKAMKTLQWHEKVTCDKKYVCTFWIKILIHLFISSMVYSKVIPMYGKTHYSIVISLQLIKINGKKQTNKKSYSLKANIVLIS